MSVDSVLAIVTPVTMNLGARVPLCYADFQGLPCLVHTNHNLKSLKVTKAPSILTERDLGYEEQAFIYPIMLPILAEQTKIVSIEVVPSGPGRTAQPTKCLLYKHENLSLDPQHPCKKSGWQHASIAPAQER